MKRALLVYLLFCLTVPAIVEAKKKSFGDGLYWELTDDGVLTISGNGPMPTYYPEKDSSKDFGIKNHKKRPWYERKDDIKEIIIVDGVAGIGCSAFYECKNLEKISIPKSVKFIEGHAFSGCRNLKFVSIPNGMQNINGGTFRDCSSLESINIPHTVKSIGNCAFEGCSSLVNVTIPNSVEYISPYAFRNCSSLVNVTIPNSVTSIGSGVFAGCSSLVNVTIPNSVTFIGSEVFAGCSRLVSLILPDSLSSIGYQDNGFYQPPIIAGCVNLKNLSIPRNVKEVSKWAFATEIESRRINKYRSNYTIKKAYNGLILSIPDFMLDDPGKWGISKESVESYKNGFCNKDGKLIIPGKKGRKINKVLDPLFVGIDLFLVEEDNKVGLIDNTMKWIIPLTDSYRKIESAGGGCFGIQSKNYEYSLIDYNGRTIIPAGRYSYIGNYNKNTKTFSVTKGRYSGSCDKQGREFNMKKLPPTRYDIKYDGGYSEVNEITDDNTKYFIVEKNGYKGLTDSEGNIIIPSDMELLEPAGTGFLRFRVADFYGIMNYKGKTVIPTSRGYTQIGNYVASQKVFPYTMDGYKGECNNLGQQISKVKVGIDARASNNSSSPRASSSSSTSSGSKTQTVVVEHHRDPVPVQEWQQCQACFGSGQCPDVKCGGSGWYYVGDRMTSCFRCKGSGKCSICAGRGGQNVTVYR